MANQDLPPSVRPEAGVETEGKFYLRGYPFGNYSVYFVDEISNINKTELDNWDEVVSKKDWDKYFVVQTGAGVYAAEKDEENVSRYKSALESEIFNTQGSVVISGDGKLYTQADLDLELEREKMEKGESKIKGFEIINTIESYMRSK